MIFLIFFTDTANVFAAEGPCLAKMAEAGTREGEALARSWGQRPYVGARLGLSVIPIQALPMYKFARALQFYKYTMESAEASYF